MSTIYLPNGAKIIMHQGWTQKTADNGGITLRSNDGQNTFFGTISSHGVVHLTDVCKYTYLPPKIDNTSQAMDVVIENIRDFSSYKLKELRNAIKWYNFKGNFWK